MQWVQGVGSNGDAKDANIHEWKNNIRMIDGVGGKQGAGDFTILGNINVRE